MDADDRKYPPPSEALRKAAAASSNEVLPGLVIGALSQCAIARRAGYQTICVRHEACSNPGCISAPVLDLTTWVASTSEMDLFSTEVQLHWNTYGKKVFIHCFHGIERAPLAVAYFIKQRVTPKMPFEDVYSFVRRMRPVAQDRTKWLEQVP